MQKLLGSPKRARRVVQWMILGALVTSALGVAANHFISSITADAGQGKTPPPATSNPWNQHSSDWWNGPNATGNPQPNWSGATSTTPSIASSNNSVGQAPAAPVGGTLHFASANTGLRENPVLVGSNASSGPIAFAGPAWMRNAPIGTAIRPFSGPSYPNSKLGKHASINSTGPQWESPSESSTNTGTASAKPVTKPFPGSPVAGQSSDGGSVFPVNRDDQIGSAELILDNPQTPGQTIASTDYTVLGLSTSSSPQDTVVSNGRDELHFSLVGQLTTVPITSSSDSTIFPDLPEPATCGMLLAGGAVLLSARRRRRSFPAA